MHSLHENSNGKVTLKFERNADNDRDSIKLDKIHTNNIFNGCTFELRPISMENNNSPNILMEKIHNDHASVLYRLDKNTVGIDHNRNNNDNGNSYLNYHQQQHHNHHQQQHHNRSHNKSNDDSIHQVMTKTGKHEVKQLGK